MTREPLDKSRLYKLLEAFGHEVKSSGNLYLTGGASALIEDWREMTIDLDCSAAPEPKGFFEAISHLKNTHNANIELSSPSDFAPALPKWEIRSEYIKTFKNLDIYHYDFYSQAFTKILRGHDRDRHDVAKMIESSKVTIPKLLEMVKPLKTDFLKYPRLDYELAITQITSWLD